MPFAQNNPPNKTGKVPIEDSRHERYNGAP